MMEELDKAGFAEKNQSLSVIVLPGCFIWGNCIAICVVNYERT